MEREQKNDQESNSDSSLDYIFSNNRFLQLLRSTKKYKELVFSKEALVSLILSIITTSLLLAILYGDSISNINFQKRIITENINSTINLIQTLLITNLAGLFGLLGFIIGGLSILSGTISTKVIDSINAKGKIMHIIRIMFSFYYTGALIGLTIVLSLFTYICTFLKMELNPFYFALWSVLLSYLSYFTLIISVMLLGTSMRFFLLNYWYYLKENQNK